MEAWFNLEPADLTVGVISGLITCLLLLPLGWFGRRLFGWLVSINDRWSLRFNQAELKRMQVFMTDPIALQRFLQQQTLWGLALLGVALMLSCVASSPISLKIAHMLWCIIGTGIYVVTIHALGTLHRLSHRPEDTIRRLQTQIERLRQRIK